MPTKTSPSLLRRAADAAEVFEKADAYVDTGDQGEISPPAAGWGVQVSWAWGSSLHGYSEVRWEVNDIVREHMDEFVKEALLRLAERADTALATALGSNTDAH